ncbi:MAG TPA: M20/M25/M40 family metallo-hydrolase [Syntrophaceticus sp.]|nr:M20/M25/M40 family metallo-hydrolase [Syntrophaceticus sp.]
MPVTVNEERLFQEFIKLAEIPSPSLKERELADYLISRLQGFGFSVEEDGTAAKIGGTTGNLLARLPGDERYPSLFFCCHMDTVVPADGVKVIFEDGVFRSKGDTVLGGDDKAGIAALLELLEMLREQDQPHGMLEILLTVGEERGLLGSRNFDYRKLEADFGYILDSSGSPGAIITAAPAQNIFNITVKGKSAHAGFEPELGVNAIRIASEVISRLPLGRIDEETTSNVGIIKGGKATNIIPDSVFIQGETRSLKREKLDDLTSRIVKEFEKIKQIPGADCEISVSLEYPEYRIDTKQQVIEFAAKAMERAGIKPRLETTGGGSDANIFNAAGLQAANLSVGMQKAHTTEEYLDSRDLVRVVQILWEMIILSTEGMKA